jgi:DNA invertase Pin-like site-specific DNA recombinase
MKTTAEIKKIALYARVSTKDRVSDSQEVKQRRYQETENQLIALREYAAKQGWEIVTEYVDHERGGTSKRPHFQRMFVDARARKFDLVLFWSLDRLSREGVSATLGHLERLTAAGVGWRSFTEEYLDSCGIFRDAVLSILATIAKQERVRRSERAYAGVARARRSGHELGRKHKLIGAKHHKALQLHSQGRSIRSIASELGVSAMTVQRTVAKQSQLEIR